MANNKKPDPEAETDRDEVTSEPEAVVDSADMDAAKTDESAPQEAAVELDEPVEEPEPESVPEDDFEPEPEPEPHVEETPEPVATVAEPPRTVERVIERRAGTGAVIVGAILAAALGFFLARSSVLDPVLPASLKRPDDSAAIAALGAIVTEQTGQLGALKQRVEAIPTIDLAPVQQSVADLSGQLAPVRDALDALAARAGAIEARFGTLETRLADLEKRPVTESVSPEAVAAYERELAAVSDAMATQRAEVEKLIAEARAMEAQATELKARAAGDAAMSANRATAARLVATMDDGAPYAPILAELSAAGVTVPTALTASAESGVATLTALRDAFPPAARDALSAARDDTKGTGGFTSFLQRQLGARSVAPRDGDDPDAVLSRAEAAVVEGRLDTALAEIATLPDAARAAMQGWVDRATERQAAVVAANALVQSLNTN